MSNVRVVLHPENPHGVGAVLGSLPGIVLECPRDADGVAACLRDGAEVLVTWGWRDDFLSPHLRWIAGTGVGIEQYPLARLAAHGITVTTAANVRSGTVAEHAFALLLALTRRIGRAARHMGEARWVRMVGDELAGRRMAILGLGAIGEQIARRAHGWDMEVAGIKRHPDRYDGCVRDVRGVDALPELCAWADILMVAAPATADGTALVGARELDLLGDGWLVNVGRGSLIDMEALAAAVDTGRLRGAGLDVTDPEPLPPDSPLWTSPRVLVTAHYAREGPGFAPQWGRLFARNLAAFRGNGCWSNLA